MSRPSSHRPRSSRPLRRRAAAGLRAAAATLLVAALAACSGQTAAAPSSSQSASTSISAERCAKNRAAGSITYLTAYAFVASPTILDTLAASELGYFGDLCLNVALQPGTTNAQLISAGTAQLGGLGSASDVMTARDSDAKNLVSIATYGNTGAIELLSMANSGITKLKDFEGKTIGYKGAMPPQVNAMLTSAGVDVSKVSEVSVGFDPTILPEGKVQGLTGYISSEPKQLAAAGDRVTEWNPADYGVKSTFNLQVANASFAHAHPTAVEDFLRATLEAYSWINASPDHLTKALGWAKAKTPSGYDLTLSAERWTTEVGLITSSQPKGTVLGQQSLAQWQPEAELLVKYHLLAGTPDPASDFTNRYLDAIYRDGQLVWPAP